MTPLVGSIGIEEVRKHTTWFLVVGIVLVILGTVAIGSAVAMTIVSVLFLGWLLIVGGVFEVVHGFSHRPWSGFFINLLGGVLYAVAGLVIAFSTPLHHRGWLVLNGAISILLGVMIWRAWPVSGLWVIGMFIGIDMIVDGWTEIMLALSARSLPA